MRGSRGSGATIVAAAQGALVGVLAYLCGYVLYTGAGLGPGFRPGMWAALVVGAAAGATRRWRWPRALLWAAVSAVAVALMVVVATPLVRPLALSVVRRDTPPTPNDVDAVVALSGDQTGAGLVAHTGIDRLLDAASLARALQRPLVVTVIHPSGAPAVSSLPDQRALAALTGVARLYSVDSVLTTHDEAVRVAALARREGWRRVAVVTSPLHTRRACATFARTGLTVRCVAARPRDMTLDGPRSLLGSAERLRAFSFWLHETLGWWSYRLHHWV